jgi:hypothetical protein
MDNTATVGPHATKSYTTKRQSLTNTAYAVTVIITKHEEHHRASKNAMDLV